MNTIDRTLTQTDVGEPTLVGKSVLVTGGGSGLGSALCQVLVAAGAKVIVGDVKQEAAEKIASSLHTDQSPTHAMHFDVGNPEAAERAIQDAVAKFGQLDILINNAGTDVTCPIEELSFEDWDRVMKTNLYGPYLLSKYASIQMRQQGSGHIVNIASTAARRAWPNAGAYHASKWGLLGLSNSLHAELRPHNIKVTAVLAGGMRTPFLLDRFPDINVETLQDPINVAKAVKSVLLLPAETVIPEIMVLPMQETSWP